MYTSHFGFREEPFNITPDPQFFYPSKSYEEAYTRIMYGIRQRKGYISLIGEAGTGKTTILNRVLANLDKNDRVASYHYNTTLTFDEFLDFICDSFALQTKGRRKRKLEKIQALDRFLHSCFAEGGTGVLIIDEAHHVADKVLEDLRLLSNIEVHNHKLLQIVLVGQPELEQKLDSARLRQLKQRIAVSCRIGRLDPVTVSLYIAHRIRTAGCSRQDLFTPQALQRIVSYSGGVPRLINTICDNALSDTAAAGQKTVGAEIIDKVAADLRLKAATEREELLPPHEQGKKVDVIRFKGDIWKRSALPAPVDAPQGRAENSLWTRSQLLLWRSAGIGAFLALLYIGRVTLFPTPWGERQTTAAVPGTPSASDSQGTSAQSPSPQPVQHASDLHTLPANANAPSAPPPAPEGSASASLSSPPDADSQDLAILPPVASTTTTPGGEVEETTPLPSTSATIALATPEAPPPATAAVHPVSSADETTEGEEQTVTVVEGDTISELALKVYGHHSILALDLIQEFNPAVTDLNRIDIGQRLVLPSLSRKTLLRQQGDGQYNLILGTFPDRYSAKCAVDFVREKGYHASIIKRRVTSDRSLYKVELKKLPDLAAVDRIWGFVGRRKS